MKKLIAGVLAGIALGGVTLACAAEVPVPEKLLGMYVHQHWAYKHPYAARTWTLEDWTGYLDGLRRLGYNSVLIWPVLETMPDPLTPSDQANLEKIAAVIELAHRKFTMRVYIVMCPNVAPRSEEGRRYTFEERPFFRTDARVDPGDPVAFGRLMAWRETLLRPLGSADGLAIIDSDPGGYPNSTLLDFVYVLGAHRRLMDRMRPGMELIYWAAHGWESYGKFYATGDSRLVGLQGHKPEELRRTITLISEQHLEPWLVASARGGQIADAIGMGDRVFAFNYGAIEVEPSFPLTLYRKETYDRPDRAAKAGPPPTGTWTQVRGKAYTGGQRSGVRGVFGNAQTHCVQLPNTFAFARGAQGLPAERQDYVAFGNDLVPGQGELLVEGWEAMEGDDAARMVQVARQLESAASANPAGGSLKGLLFGSAPRLLLDLARQLHLVASQAGLKQTVTGNPRNAANVAVALRTFVAAAQAWQNEHGYTNAWRWAPLLQTLRQLDAAEVNLVLAVLAGVKGEGATTMEKVNNWLAEIENFTPRLLTALEGAATSLEAKPAPGVSR